MEPTEADTSTTGPAPMNRLPGGPRSKAEAGEHGLPVDADPEELEQTDELDEAGEPNGARGDDRGASGSGALG